MSHGCWIGAAVLIPVVLNAAETPEIPEFHRIIDRHLTVRCWSPGPPLADRETWGRIAASPVMRPVLSTAATLAAGEVKPPDESLYPALAAEAYQHV